jgi:predicted ribosome-associated RNA-binding protein Tma20/translation initiation factor 1 (eIF-1/SUI1)
LALRRGGSRRAAPTKGEALPPLSPQPPTAVAQATMEKTKLKTKVCLFSLQGEACPLLADISGGKGPAALLPTLFAAWREPSILPCLLIHHSVSVRIIRGADLMAPGVLIPPRTSLPDLAAGAPVLIRVVGNPMAVAVGVMDMSSTDALAGGMRGRIVRVIHRFRDTLWAFGGRATPNDGFTPKRALPLASFIAEDIAANGWADESEATGAEDDGEDDDAVEDESVSAAAASAPPAAVVAEDEAATASTGAGGEDGGASSSSSLLSRLQGLSMDELLLSTVLQALRTRVKASMLPLLANVFYAAHVLPSRPRETQLDVRKTKWGKLSELLEELTSGGMLKTQATDDGVLRIVDIDRSHPLLKAHLVWPRELSEDSAAAEEDEEHSVAAIGAEEAELVGLDLVDMLKPKAGVEQVYAVVLQEIAKRAVERAREGGEPFPNLLGKDVSHLRRRGDMALSEEEQIRLALANPFELFRTRLFVTPEVNRVLGLYASVRRLQDPVDKSLMLVDDVLQAALNLSAGDMARFGAIESGKAAGFPSLSQAVEPETEASSVPIDPEAMDLERPRAIVGRFPKRDAALRFGGMHSPWYILTRATGEVECKSGSPPMVHLVVEQVRGRKKHVTHVRGLEALGLPLVPLARHAQKLFACSATVQTVPTNPSQQEVLVQGDVGEPLADVLSDEYGIPRKMISCTGGSGKKKQPAASAVSQQSKRR